MSDLDDAHGIRRIAEQLMRAAHDELGLSTRALHRVIASSPSQRAAEERGAYEAVASLADSMMGRLPLADGIVDGFYSSALKGEPGETLFVGGLDALLMHGYPAGLIAQLPVNATQRFLGLGNVWRDVVPRPDCRMIDIGCGSGVDLAVGAAHSPDSAFVVGLDKRPDLLGVAAEACPRASLVVGDITAPPVAAGSFDVVVANGLPPAQRPSTVAGAAKQLLALAAPNGVVSATVIIAAPSLTSALAEAYPEEGTAFVGGLATLFSGKPTAQNLMAAFSLAGVADVTIWQGVNPYRDVAVRQRTALVTLTAMKE